ncbi:MAG: hypothetical protein A3K65_02625 [Euryarchaeota archaeon RBG_16_68_12]|nr:MAG: hypothetical protein A3K65_02625 [Euryarchaeota archaeon RBG_16_68_12]
MVPPPKAADDEYIKNLEFERREKDHFFKEHPQSPIPWALRDAFTGLAYFPPNPTYRLTTKLIRYPKPEPITMVTSKGVPREMLKWGYFEFTIDGQIRRLQAYKSIPKPGEHEESLFVPFRDGTSGKESYGAARYLDLPIVRGEKYVLDFNLAYDPYCAYSDDYVCPFPPRENWLDLRIEAGEKDFPLADLKGKLSAEGKLGHRH